MLIYYSCSGNVFSFMMLHDLVFTTTIPKILKHSPFCTQFILVIVFSTTSSVQVDREIFLFEHGLVVVGVA